MVPSPPGDITALLGAIRSGESAAQHQVVQRVYDRWHRIAAALMRRERGDHTLGPTALLHEAFIRLVAGGVFRTAANRAVLYAAAARAMRQTLADHARRRDAAKRGGGGHRRVPLDGLLEHFETQRIDVLALRDAIDRLEALHERQSLVVTLRCFGGFTVREIASLLDVSVATVENDFRFARAWLWNHLGGDDR
jgi:RNA polymerase sigma factor (TIGR02999 family)